MNLKLAYPDQTSGFKDEYLSGTHMGKFSASTKNVSSSHRSRFLSNEDLTNDKAAETYRSSMQNPLTLKSDSLSNIIPDTTD